MIELVKLEEELYKAWPMPCEGTKQKWIIIQNTIACLNRLAELRQHTPEESTFISNYHELRSSYDPGYFVDIESGKYETRYLPLELCNRLHTLYTSINHV